MMRGFWNLVLLLVSILSCCLNTAYGNEPPVFEEDVLELMEPAIVPDPVNGEHWWYAPSPRAHLYSHKYRHRLEKMLRNKNIGVKADEGNNLQIIILKTAI